MTYPSQQQTGKNASTVRPQSFPRSGRRQRKSEKTRCQGEDVPSTIDKRVEHADLIVTERAYDQWIWRS